MIDDRFSLSRYRLMRLSLTCLGLAILAGCSDATYIQDAVRESLIDPDSAKFGEIIEYTGKDGSQLACVEVNAKNRMGGYAGDELFLAMENEGEWQAMNLNARSMGVDGASCAWFVESIADKAS